MSRTTRFTLFRSRNGDSDARTGTGTCPHCRAPFLLEGRIVPRQETKFGPIEQHVEGETLPMNVVVARAKRSPVPWPADLEPPQLTLNGMR